MEIELTFTCREVYTDADGYRLDEYCNTVFTSKVALVNNSHLVRDKDADTDPTLNIYATCTGCGIEHELDVLIKPQNADILFGDQSALR